MPSDALNYSHLARELDLRLGGGRIERVSMPSQSSVILFVKPKGERKAAQLLLSAESARPRVHVTAEKGENPLSAYAFLMHLRKRVTGGTITSVSTLPHERIFKIEIGAYDELGYPRSFTLYAEMMGRYSNLVLVGSDGKITDALKRISLDEGQKHALLPALPYTAPPAPDGKCSPDDDCSVKAVLDGFDGGNLASHIMGGVFGYAPATMREIIYRAYGTLTPDPEAVKADKNAFLRELKAANERFEPCVNERLTDFFAFPYTHTGEKFIPAESLSAAMETVFSRVVENGYERGKAAKLITHLKSAIKKNERSMQILKQRIIDCADYENDRILGELITSNMYKLRGGEKEIEVDDYYTGEKRIIPLDSTLSPALNAQKYYKSYNKKKTSIEKSNEMLLISDEKAEYYDSILAALSSADDEATLGEIAAEMSAAGILSKKGAKKKSKPASPMKLTVGGLSVKIGKNNAQNDALVRASDGGWLWLHTQKIHGSHAVIESTNPPQEVINEVAAYVAFYSKAGKSANVPVDYTLIKYVKKPSGAPLGKVVYTHQQTVNVTPRKP